MANTTGLSVKSSPTSQTDSGPRQGDPLTATDTNSGALIQTPRFRCGFVITIWCRLQNANNEISYS